MGFINSTKAFPCFYNNLNIIPLFQISSNRLFFDSFTLPLANHAKVLYDLTAFFSRCMSSCLHTYIYIYIYIALCIQMYSDILVHTISMDRISLDTAIFATPTSTSADLVYTQLILNNQTSTNMYYPSDESLVDCVRTLV